MPDPNALAVPPSPPARPAHPQPAATVMLLRDAPTGLQVFLLRRSRQSAVLGGAYVFPGGKVENEDAGFADSRRCDQPRAALLANLNEPGLSMAEAARLYGAAARETLEECGVLLAQGASREQALQGQSLLDQGLNLDATLQRLNLRLETRALRPWSRWITPETPLMMNRRFDTRFFVAALPDGQVARHDDHEASDSIWLTPREALERAWQRDIELAPPQVMSLAHLARLRDVAAVLGEARRHPPPTISPCPLDHAGERGTCYPGDPGHPSRQRVMPGPTRLILRQGRLEPEDGFEAFFR
ncbi:MAG: NUDIX hydrolase [Rhodoferax sp.]|nr:NUDIX hydrolase [Rhodoferax sp.]